MASATTYIPGIQTADVERYLVETGHRMAMAEFGIQKIVTQDGREHFVDKSGHFLAVPGDVRPMAKPLSFFTLQSICDYIKEDPDELFHGDGGWKYFLKISDANHVELLSPIYGETKQRATIAACAIDLRSDRQIRYTDPETFQTIVQTRFVDTEARKLLLQVAGNLKKEQGMQTADDGVSQKLTVMTGVSTTANVKWVNPTPLRMIRTFPEIEQPESAFVFRVNQEGECALFEDENAIWQLEAIDSIKAFLKEHVDETANVAIIG